MPKESKKFNETKTLFLKIRGTFINAAMNDAENVQHIHRNIKTGNAQLSSFLEQIRSGFFKEEHTFAIQQGSHIFIGHGQSQLWRELKDFMSERLRLSCDEFNRVSTAGLSITGRLKQMLDQARFAFLIMTAEDEQVNGHVSARANVIHEVGLFQGRLGFNRAIILLEDGCEEFSNIHGLVQIRFPKGNISACFEKIRSVLEREGIIRAIPETA